MVYKFTMEWIVGGTTESERRYVELTDAEVAKFHEKYHDWQKEGDTVWYTIEPNDDEPDVRGLKELEDEIASIKNNWY